MRFPSNLFRRERPVRSPHRIDHDELLAHLKKTINAIHSSGVAVLMVNLRFSNRLGIITGTISAETVSRFATHRLERVLRATDRYAHLSNDQICVVLPNLADAAQSVLAAHKILAALREPYGLEEKMVWLSPHIGIALHPAHAADATQLLMFADMAARVAAGTAEAYYVHQKDSSEEEDVYRGLELQLAAAIRSNELNVHYQPQVEIATGHCVAVEALLRWRPMGDRFVAPPAIINLAECTGLIGPFTQWLLNTTFRNTVEFERAGIPIGVSINLSAKTLSDEDFPELVRQSLATWQVAPERITFEITESSTIGEPEKALTMLRQIHGLGARLSLDDFGTGYSSLAYLKQFPLHELKIDQLFVRNMLGSASDRAIVRAVIDLAHNFGLLSVAEGVEDKSILDVLAELNCDLAQGYWFSRALVYEQLVDWYRAR